MKHFPRYRIYTLVGWLLPLAISITISYSIDMDWYWKVLLVVILYPLFLILEVLVYKALTDIWNSYQENKEQN